MVTPTGNVQIWSFGVGSGNLIATATLDGSGNYTVNSSALTAAVTAGIPVYAYYEGDAGHSPSTSPAVSDVVNTPVQGTTTTLGIVPNPATVGASQTFSGTVS